jgi:ADP-heptose:LPS heptosyltransferase
LAALAPLANVVGVRYVSLQKDVRPVDAKSLALFPGMLDFSADLADFDETAALVSRLDLVITVDSAVAHLAGALGKPVWMMTPRPADWRWQADRNDSPWYRTLRLFRQPQPGIWSPVIDAIRAELARLAASEMRPS